MVFLSQDSRVWVSKSRELGLLGLWNPITLRIHLGLRCSLKQSCNSYQELFNGMLHALCSQVNRVDFRLFPVGSQIDSLTPGPSFGHNLCFKCPNEQCKRVLDIYESYKERHKPLNIDPWNCFLKFWKSTRILFPKVGVALGVWGFTPSYSLTLSYILGSMWCDSQASSWPAPLRPLCLDSWASSWLTTL